MGERFGRVLLLLGRDDAQRETAGKGGGHTQDMRGIKAVRRQPGGRHRPRAPQAVELMVRALSMNMHIGGSSNPSRARHVPCDH